MRILIATDAWHPQVNGVVRTLSHVAECMRDAGHEVTFLTPQGRRNIGLPSYPEIRLAFVRQREIAQLIGRFQPDAIHIATEGPIGWAIRRYCQKHGVPFTTSYHTRFPEYVTARLPIPGVLAMAYSIVRRFHRPSKAVLTPTAAITQVLQENRFVNVKTWTRGVDHDLFKPFLEPRLNTNGVKPVLVYVGRLAVEKNVEAFLDADVPGTKLLIGDGPQKAALEKKYPDAIFAGYLFGEELARKMGEGDIFVFPSKTDTFGLVMVEAMACGMPVAAYPVPGPIDVVEHGVSGWLDDDLATAIKGALSLKRQAAIDHAATFTWEETARQMMEAFVPFVANAGTPSPAAAE